MILVFLAFRFCLDLHSQSTETDLPLESRKHWNRFRGPNGSGVMKNARIPVRFGPNLNVLWKTPIEEGPSSPVIWGDRIFLTAASSDETNQLVAVCINRSSGKVLWKNSITNPKPRKYFSFGSPVAPTPVVDAEHVYVSYPAYGLICYDHDGTKVWERRFEPTTHLYGMAVSPIVYRDTLILDGGEKHSRLLALDRNSGKTTWKHRSPLFRQGWSTPVIWFRSGVEELVALGSRRLTSFDPTNGNEKWWVGGFAGEVVGVPVIGEGLLFASSGQASHDEPDLSVENTWKVILEDHDQNDDGDIQRTEMDNGFRIPLRLELERDEPGAAYSLKPEWANGLLDKLDVNNDGKLSKKEWQEYMSGSGSKFRPTLVAIRPGAKGDARRAHLAWEYHRGIPEVPSLLYCRGNIYMFRNGGLVTCLKAKDGKELYKGRVGAGGQYIASPIAAGDKIITASQNGVVSVIQAGDQLEILARNDFEEQIVATPALAGNQLYIRTTRFLFAIGE